MIGRRGGGIVCKIKAISNLSAIWLYISLPVSPWESIRHQYIMRCSAIFHVRILCSRKWKCSSSSGFLVNGHNLIFDGILLPVLIILGRIAKGNCCKHECTGLAKLIFTYTSVGCMVTKWVYSRTPSINHLLCTASGKANLVASISHICQ